MNPSQVIKDVCESLLSGDERLAGEIARLHYPFRPTTYKEISAASITPKIQQAREIYRLNPPPKPAMVEKRTWNDLSYTRLFIHDGFVDRYSGQQLVFPATLRLLSILMKDEFPEHPNWKLDRGHIMYWQLYPTLDHIEPLAREGKDIESNWVSTSWLNNYIKSDFTLEEIGWSLYPEGNFREWDGLLHWFVEYVERNPEYLSYKFLDSCYVAATRYLEELSNNAGRT